MLNTGIYRSASHIVALTENALFKSSGIGIICSLPDDLQGDKRDSNGLFSTILGSRPSVCSRNLTDLSLVTLK